MNKTIFPMFLFLPKRKIMKTTLAYKSRIFAGMVILFTILSISGSCKKSMNNMSGTGNKNSTGNSGGPGTNEVWIQGMAFTPTSITVSAGTTITWTNKDAVAHTVTSNTGVFSSGSIATSGTYSYLFSTAGTYPYHCTIHPSMTGTVTVN